MISYILGSDFFEFAKQALMVIVPILAIIAIGISLKNFLSGAGQAAKGIGGGIGDALSGVGGLLDGAGSGVGKASSGVGSGGASLLGETVKLAGKAIGGTAKLAGKGAKEAAKLAGKGAKEAAKLAGKGTKEAAKLAAKGASAAASKGKETIRKGAQGARERVEGAREGVRRKAWEMGEQAAGRSGTGVDYESRKPHDQRATSKAARAYSADGLLEIAQANGESIEELEARLRAAGIFYTVDWDVDEEGNEIYRIKVRKEDEELVSEELEAFEEELLEEREGVKEELLDEIDGVLGKREQAQSAQAKQEIDEELAWLDEELERIENEVPEVEDDEDDFSWLDETGTESQSIVEDDLSWF